MPQDSLLPDEAPLVGLQITIEGEWPTLHDGITIRVATRGLDESYASLVALRLEGRGCDLLASTIEDLVHSWLYEDKRAIVREAQRDQRLASRHARSHY